jgi:DNA-binding transcriptional LysR family regulator
VLDLRRLRLLHELHRLGTVSAVADALSYSPSTVSQQLKVLEREAGTPLFEPAGRGVRLTDAALVLAEHAQRLLADAERAEADLAAAAGAVAGVVRVGSFQTASLRLLLPAMDALREAHPAVQVRLVEAEPEPALEALSAHALDLVVADEWAGTPRPRRPGIEREDLFTEAVLVVLPAGHPAAAASGAPVALAALAGEVWATGYPRGGMAALVRRVCNEHGGFEPDVRHETNELTMLLALVAARQAVTLLPELALVGDTDGVVARPVADAAVTRTLLTAVRAGADRRPALAAVRAAIRAAARAR